MQILDARPRGPTTKREPSPEGLGIDPEDDLSAVGAALNPGQLAPGVIALMLCIGAWKTLWNGCPFPCHPACLACPGVPWGLPGEQPTAGGKLREK